MANLRVALLGAGNISATHISAIRQLSGIEIVGVCDIDYKRASGLQEKEGIAGAWDNVDQMLRECRPGIVHVLLPPPAHHDAAIKCLDAGSHVFMEKPFCMTVAECRNVQKTAERAGLTVGVNHNMAFTPGMMLLIEAIRDLRLGAVEHVAVSYSLPIPGLKKGLTGPWMFGETGRIMLEVGPHPVSVVCRLMGAVKQATTAVAGEIILPDNTRLFSTWMSSMVCERGTGTVMLSTGIGFGSISVHVIGEDGEAFVDLRRNTVRISAKDRYIRAGDLMDGLRNGMSVARQSFRNFRASALGSTGLGKPYVLQDMAVRNSLESFYNALRSGHAPLIGAEQGTNVVEACHMIIDGARRFAEEREPVAVG